MAGVMLAVIHNGELPGSPAQVVVEELREAEVVDAVVEVTEQPDLSADPDRAALLAWRRRQRDLERRWWAYLGQPVGRVRSATGSAAFSMRVRTSRAFADAAWRARQIERFVTAKHIGAWRAFTASAADHLVVIESDAVIRSRTTDAIDAIVVRTEGRAAYANLAGGLAWTDIGIDALAGERSDLLVHFRKPVTNTSCSYVINRQFAGEILAFLDATPSMTDLGIDWLFNAFFMHAEQLGIDIDCWHADPPALGHGSLTGITRSWHPDR